MQTRDFSRSLAKSAVVENRRKAGSNGTDKRGTPLAAPAAPLLAASEAERLLRIITKTSRIKCHYDLFELLQGEDVQNLIPHQILISAWGDFGGTDLKRDMISAIPGVRTGLLDQFNIDGLLKDLYKRWLDEGRQPMLLDSTMDVSLACASSSYARHKYLQGHWSLLVHGVIDACERSNSLYLTLNPHSIVNGRSIEHFCYLADALITQIEIGYRRIGAMKSPGMPAAEAPSSRLRVLSPREEEILPWLSEGKTNVEISKILGISSFTVKNLLQRIMKKLNVNNRTQVVAKHRQMRQQP